MRKSLAILLLSAVALVGAAAPASAAGSTPTPDPTVAGVSGTLDDEAGTTEDEQVTTAVDCIPAAEARFRGRIDIAAQVVSAQLLGPEGATLCEQVVLNVTWFALPATWDGNGFNDSALPQSLIDHVDLTAPQGMPAGDTVVTDQLPLPECVDYQLDLYYGEKRTEITKTSRIGSDLIRARFVNVDEDADICKEPTPTTPAETTTTPAETTTTPAETTTTTTPAETTTTPPSATTTVPTTAPVASTTPATVTPTTTAPALAFTGVGGTGALIGLAAVLLLGGVAIVFVTASTRRTPGTRRG